jgi:hypothetical protein
MKTWTTVLMIMLYLVSALFAYAIVNTMVSLKYETNSPDDCISIISGIDLCKSIHTSKLISVSSFALATALLLFKGISAKENRKVIK